VHFRTKSLTDSSLECASFAKMKNDRLVRERDTKSNKQRGTGADWCVCVTPAFGACQFYRLLLSEVVFTLGLIGDSLQHFVLLCQIWDIAKMAIIHNRKM
jgi:hypothetical protein